jgi:hypothetical protein
LNCNTIAFTQRYRCCSRPCQTMIHAENIWKCRDRCVMTPITKSVVDTSSAEGKAGSSLRKLKRLKRYRCSPPGNECWWISQKLLARNQPHASALPVRLREQLGGAMHLDGWDVLLKWLCVWS